MDDGLKQRLIGAIVLIAIAVLFLPTLFDTEGRRTIDLATQVPPRPVIVAESLELPIPQQSDSARPAKSLQENYNHNQVEQTVFDLTKKTDDIESVTTIDVAPKVTPDSDIKKESVVRPEPPKPTPLKTISEPVLNADGVPQAWAIQVASFSDMARAETMLKNLEKVGYPKSYIRPGKGPNGEVYRVFVGPKINKQQAEDDRAAIDKALNVKSLLIKFQP